METELKSLEEKLLRLIRSYQNTHLENIKLRQQLTDTEDKNERLTKKIHVAANRLEALLTNIPDSDK